MAEDTRTPPGPARILPQPGRPKSSSCLAAGGRLPRSCAQPWKHTRSQMLSPRLGSQGLASERGDWSIFPNSPRHNKNPRPPIPSRSKMLSNHGALRRGDCGGPLRPNLPPGIMTPARQHQRERSTKLSRGSRSTSPTSLGTSVPPKENAARNLPGVLRHCPLSTSFPRGPHEQGPRPARPGPTHLLPCRCVHDGLEGDLRA